MNEKDDDWMAHIDEPSAKRAVSIRLDEDVIDYFKKDGKGYQTRINQVLRSYMTAMKSREK